MIRRVAKEVAELTEDPVPGIALWPHDESDLTDLEAAVEGPPGTPFSEGVFFFRISLPSTYPYDPPKVLVLHFGEGALRERRNLDGG